MERWIIVEIDRRSGHMRMLENGGGDQETARRYACRTEFAPRRECWVGIIPFDLIATEEYNYITDKPPVRPPVETNLATGRQTGPESFDTRKRIK